MSGVPQGGGLSPLIFIIYVADPEDWLIHSTASTYADDTETYVSGTILDEIISKLEEDGLNVLIYNVIYICYLRSTSSDNKCGTLTPVSYSAKHLQ